MIKPREWRARAMYMLVAVVLAVSLIIAAAPFPTVLAANGNDVTAEWDTVGTPSMDGFVLAPESTIIDYALASQGEMAYAVVEAWDEDYEEYEYRLLKSEDHAATWEDITEALEDVIDVDGGDYIDEVVQVATDWEDPDFVAVALWWWDESAGNYYLHVFISDDGGETFVDADEVEDGGVYFPDPTPVSDLAVSYENADGKRDIAIGGIDNSGNSALFRCTVTGDSPGAWKDATDYDGWDDDGDFTSFLVTDVIFSPSWATDKTILVTTVAPDFSYYTVHLQCGSWGTSPGWNEFSTLGIPAVPIIEDVDIPMWLMDWDARAIAGMTLPEDYNSKNTDTRLLWIWVNYYDPDDGVTPACEIMRVDDDDAHPVGPLGQILEGTVWLTNVSYKGTIDSGEAIAGVLGDGTGQYTECCDGVQTYRNDAITDMDICCLAWKQACKPPTGRYAMAAFYVSDNPATSKAYAVALGPDPFWDEGAWSVSFDDGDIWNQLSLVDTHIDYLSDFAVSPNCNKTMLASANVEYGCGCDSVWLKAMNLPEAEEYSGKWLRTWCGELGNNYGLLRLAPEETSGDTVYLIDYGTDTVYWNDVETLACWAVGCAPVNYIVDLAVKDKETIYALDGDGTVAMSDGHGVSFSWYEPVDSKVGSGCTITVRGDDILVGGQSGEVSHSADGGETFTELEDVAASGYVTVAFDSYFDANDTVYVTLTGSETNGICRWVIDQSTEWENIGAEDYDYTGLVLDRPAPGNLMTSADTGGVIYASYIGGNITGVARCLTPAEDVCCGSTNWDYLIVGLTPILEGFDTMPQALKICGCLTTGSNSKLAAIDGSEPYDMEKAEIGTVWSFEDCYAKAAPDLTSPAEGATIAAAPSECVNVAFTLMWERRCDSCVYDIQIALDEDFTGVVVDEEGYLPSAPATPSYLVAEGDLSCKATYYWRVRSVEAETGQGIHSWWSEPRSLTVTNGGVCFIATAAYGTPMAEEIQILREFRDEYLLTNPVGKALVGFYYKASPPIALFITEHPATKPVVRTGLLPAVAMSAIAVNTTPTEKAAIAGLLVLVSVAVAVRATRRRGRGPEYA